MLITDARALADACLALKDETVLAFDTEFVFERTYRPTLGLVQIAGRGGAAFAVDPLAVPDLSPLWALLLDDARTTVVHAGLMDFSILYAQTGGRVPRRVFDTQIAAAFLGYGPQVGYASLVEAELGLRVDKVETHTDWLRRPLTDAQLTYALGDVTHLLLVYEKLEAALRARGRETWVTEECERAMEPSRYADPDPREVFWSLKRAGSLRRLELAALRELAEWRELEARARNLRPHILLRDEVVVAIAKRLPTAEVELGHVRGFPAAEQKRSAEHLLAAVARARALPPEAWPTFERPEGADPLLDVSATILGAFVQLRAREVEVSAETLAPRQTLRALLRHGFDGTHESGAKILGEWRRELLGPDLEKLLRGEVAIALDPATRRPRVRDVA